MREVLDERQFPVGEVRLLASERSVGQFLPFQSRQLPVEVLKADSFKDIDIALFSAGGSVSSEFAPMAVAAGAVVIDNTSVFRMEPDIPPGGSRGQCQGDRQLQMPRYHRQSHPPALLACRPAIRLAGRVRGERPAGSATRPRSALVAGCGPRAFDGWSYADRRAATSPGGSDPRARCWPGGGCWTLLVVVAGGLALEPEASAAAAREAEAETSEPVASR